MVREVRIYGSHSHVSPLRRLRKRSRSVRVQVFEGGREVDNFTVSDPQVFHSELKSVYRHLSKQQGLVQLKGVEEDWLPLGIDRVRRETGLRNAADALFFLAA